MSWNSPKTPNEQEAAQYEHDIAAAVLELQKAETAGEIEEILQTFIDAHLVPYLMTEMESHEPTSAKSVELRGAHSSEQRTGPRMEFDFEILVTRNDGEVKTIDLAPFFYSGKDTNRHDLWEFMDGVMEALPQAALD